MNLELKKSANIITVEGRCNILELLSSGFIFDEVIVLFQPGRTNRAVREITEHFLFIGGRDGH